MNKIVHFLNSEEGATAVEYAVLLSLIVAVAASSIAQVGSRSNSAFSSFCASWAGS